jgi:hypothetical protein
MPEGARSGEDGGWAAISITLLAMNCCDTMALWGRALSAWTIRFPTSTLTPLFRQLCPHFAHIIARVEFALTIKGGHNCKTGRNPHDNEYHFFELNFDTFQIRNFSIRRELYEFMICNVVEPGLTQYHDIVPGSGFLFPQYPQKGL